MTTPSGTTQAGGHGDGPARLGRRLGFGVLVPTFSPDAPHRARLEELRGFARQVEEGGFESLWVIDHNLPAPVYAQTWLEPLTTLAHLAAVTQRCMIGTCVLIAPLRNPVLFAKEVATLQFLSGGRFVCGIGVGWNPIEFAAVGIDKSERGGRTDEVIEILRLAQTRERFSYAGRYYDVPELSVEPLPEVRPPLWIGGGRQPAAAGASEVAPRTPESVIERMARSDGWLAQAMQDESILGEDWARVLHRARALGRDPADLVLAQANYVHVVDTSDRQRAHAEQERAFAGYVGAERPWSFVRDYYLVGSVEDIVQRVQRRIDAGVRHVVFGPVTRDPDAFGRQLRLLTERVVPALRDPAREKAGVE